MYLWSVTLPQGCQVNEEKYSFAQWYWDDSVRSWAGPRGPGGWSLSVLCPPLSLLTSSDFSAIKSLGAPGLTVSLLPLDIWQHALRMFYAKCTHHLLSKVSTQRWPWLQILSSVGTTPFTVEPLDLEGLGPSEDAGNVHQLTSCQFEPPAEKPTPSEFLSLFWTQREHLTSSLKTVEVFFSFFFFLFFFLRAALSAYGSSQARGCIGAAPAGPTPQPQQCQIRAASVTYTAAHNNTGSPTHWARPGIEPASAWILVDLFLPHSKGPLTVAFLHLNEGHRTATFCTWHWHVKCASRQPTLLTLKPDSPSHWLIV